jgi:signal transduction histidine kinase/ActR/RegA family two-component response regulator
MLKLDPASEFLDEKELGVEPHAIETEILVELARRLHTNMPTSVFGALVGVGLVAVLFGRSIESTHLAAWLSIVALHTSYRLAFWYRFSGRPFTPEVSRRWMRPMAGGVTLGSVIYFGVPAWFFMPSSTIENQYAFLCILSFVSVGAIMGYGPHFSTFTAAIMPYSLATVLAIALGRTGTPFELMLAIVAFIVFLLVAGKRFAGLTRESLRLGFENIDLVLRLTEQKNAAEAANLAKSRFLAAASHDLRQPMHALNLYLGTASSCEMSEPARTAVASARQCAEAMDEMFRALLDVSQLDAGSVRSHVEVFPISMLLNRSFMEFEPQARERSLSLHVVQSSAWVRSDPALVERILRNFVTNAVRHCERGRILIGCRLRGDIVRLSVHDTGPGIPEHHQAAIFEEFFQLKNPERDRGKGLGLGLGIVKRLAHLLRVSVILQSSPGHGSMFAVDLPRAAEADAVPGLPHEKAVQGDLSNVMVLVVDDERSILRATQGLLETWGCAVATATNAAEAIACVNAMDRLPDLLICDYRLRANENGIDIVHAVRRAVGMETPALLVTGETSPDQLRTLHESGLPVLHKPLQEKSFRQALERLVKGDAD